MLDPYVLAGDFCLFCFSFKLCSLFSVDLSCTSAYWELALRKECESEGASGGVEENHPGFGGPEDVASGVHSVKVSPFSLLVSGLCERFAPKGM